MVYLISQILMFLVLAAAIGLLIGWLLRGLAASGKRSGGLPTERQRLLERVSELEQEVQAYQAELADFAETTRHLPTRPTTTTFAIEDIEGIGPGYGRRLRSLGIETTRDLLEKCGSADMRKAIAQSIGIEEPLLRRWMGTADLMRITGVSSQFAELLKASGVDSVQQLAAQDPDALANRMADVNAREQYTRTVPGAPTVATWVEQAKK